MKPLATRCPAEMTLRVMDGPWKIPILWRLAWGPLRFSQLRRDLAGCTPKMLTRQLREMEGDGLVIRKVYPQVPPKVEYSLSSRGKTLQPVVRAMCRWGSKCKRT